MWTKYIDSHCRHTLKALRACPCFPTEWICQYRPANSLPPELNNDLNLLLYGEVLRIMRIMRGGQGRKGSFHSIYWWQSRAWLELSMSQWQPKRQIFLALMWGMEEKPVCVWMSNVYVHEFTRLRGICVFLALFLNCFRATSRVHNIYYTTNTCKIIKTKQGVCVCVHIITYT